MHKKVFQTVVQTRLLPSVIMNVIGNPQGSKQGNREMCNIHKYRQIKTLISFPFIRWFCLSMSLTLINQYFWRRKNIIRDKSNPPPLTLILSCRQCISLYRSV